MDSVGKLTYSIEYSTSFSDNIVTKAYVDTMCTHIEEQSSIISTDLHHAIQYMEYLSENLNNTMGIIQRLEKNTVKKNMNADNFFHDKTFEDY